MIPKILVDGEYNAVARLIPDQKVEIFEPNRKKWFEEGGIDVSRAFVEEHGIQGKRLTVYPKDGSAVFAKAFEYFYNFHGLPHGFKWIDEAEYKKRHQISKLSDQELANMVLEIWKSSHSE